MSTRKILVTSALPYANGPIHLGHLLEYIQTDIWARFQKGRGHECYYVCADDAHGTPIMLKAQEQGITPEQMIAKTNIEHQADFAGFGIGFDNYHSTHSEENREFASQIYNKLNAGGYIKRKTISQLFDPQKQMFLPDRFVKGDCPKCGALDQNGDSCDVCGATYSPTEVKNARSVVSGATPVLKDSEHYFFDLPAFSQMLQDWTRSGSLQDEMANKLQEWFKDGLQMWDISRDAPYFGFEIPGAPGKFFYVWLDAPIGYLASFKNLCDKTGINFDDFWKLDSDAEVYHFIGKDIVNFHALFWPAMLHSANLRTPTKICVHGFLTVNGTKMSKSRGTFINARTYLDHLNPEYLRYYFAAKLTSKLPIIPEEHAQSSAATVLRKLTAKLTEEDINQRCAFPAALNDERLALETALAQANPEVAHAKAVGELERLSQMATSISALKESLNGEKAQALLDARSNAEVKRQAATAYATAFLNGLPLKGVGDAVWRTLWDAAKAYSTGLAYRDHPFPHVGDESRCVLCQQPLGDDGKARLASFESYLNDTLQTEAKSAEDALTALKKALPSPLTDVAWQAQCAAIGLEAPQATELFEAIHARLKAMAEATAAPAVQWSVWTNAYDQKVKTTSADRDALAGLLDPTGRKEKESRLAELKAQQWLSEQRDAVWADVIRLKRVGTVEAAVRSTSTSQLTTKSNDIGESELAKGYCDRFNAELRALGGHSLPVRMSYRSQGKGAFTFYVELKDAQGAQKNREILSEGEQRIVALAAFLGFTPVFTDTYEKADQGHEECSCRSEGSSAPSSSAVRLSRPASRASAVPRWPGSWGSGMHC